MPSNYTPYYTFYWIQRNGLDERFNQTLQTMLAKFVHDKKEWSDLLDTSVFAYNTSRHESSKFTPFELMFNRKATIPIDVELRTKESKELAVTFLHMQEPDQQAREEERKKLLEESKQNIVCAQKKKQKELYDKKHAKPHLYEPGQLVLKKDFTRSKRKGGKLDAKYLGPFTIKGALGNGTYSYLLSCCKKPESTIQATGAHLKPYIPSSNSPADTLDSSDPPADNSPADNSPADTLDSSDPPADTRDSSDPPADKLLFDTFLFHPICSRMKMTLHSAKMLMWRCGWISENPKICPHWWIPVIL